ncbi:hypothetical protein PTKU64_77330 [Paraburkholderia terrae]|uniref:Uncharacterized protein n=1 Tax=Paraburkholderia terrae TaxID=311230 RepID=A0ABN6JSW7_9BURK|nr:hypothetical protein PTKU64_77330 [Paraburkholderia terrae]
MGMNATVTASRGTGPVSSMLRVVGADAVLSLSHRPFVQFAPLDYRAFEWQCYALHVKRGFRQEVMSVDDF